MELAPLEAGSSYLPEVLVSARTLICSFPGTKECNSSGRYSWRVYLFSLFVSFVRAKVGSRNDFDFRRKGSSSTASLVSESSSDSLFSGKFPRAMYQ
jgi:hypothetical protein